MNRRIMKSKVVVASATVYSEVAGLADHMTSHAIQYVITGDGTCSITTYTGIGPDDWIKNSTVATGLTDASGPGSDGKDTIPLSLKPGEQFRVDVEETGTSDTVTLDMWFVQK